jgi:hypothetical protein
MGAEERLLLAIDGLVAVCRTALAMQEAAGSCAAVCGAEDYGLRWDGWRERERRRERGGMESEGRRGGR